MVLTTKMESAIEALQATKSVLSKPIDISNVESKDELNPHSARQEHTFPQTHVMRFLHQERHREDQQEKELLETQRSIEADDDYPRIPEGSPTFISVMEELNIKLSENSIKDEQITPISPLASNDREKCLDVTDHAEVKVEMKASGSPISPILVRKQRGKSATTTASNSIRTRSYSWNYRHKMASDRRKHVSLVIPESGKPPSSTSSSPLSYRKSRRTKSQPNTPKVVHLIPKYKFLTETISVSHEDLVKEQEREREDFMENYSKAKSIFQMPNLHHFDDSFEL